MLMPNNDIIPFTFFAVVAKLKSAALNMLTIRIRSEYSAMQKFCVLLMPLCVLIIDLQFLCVYGRAAASFAV